MNDGVKAGQFKAASSMPMRGFNRWSQLRSGIYLASLIGLLAGLGLVAGCRTISPGGVPAIDATLASDGTVRLGSDCFPAKELPSRLKRHGAGRATTVCVVVPPDMTQASMAVFLRDLRLAGFQKIIFKRPLQPEASVNR
jgi:hypothetical protein